MPITIGAKPAGDFSNPLELLSDCHRRIERFLAVLVKVARDARGGPLTELQKTEWTISATLLRAIRPTKRRVCFRVCAKSKQHKFAMLWITFRNLSAITRRRPNGMIG